MNVIELNKDPAAPQQARSRARKAALIEHGITVLEDHELDEISIIDLTNSLGFSTGSFYSYFKNKTDFFIKIQEWVAAEQSEIIRQSLNLEKLKTASLVDRLNLAIDVALDYFRRHTGVIRSALRYERRIPQAWAPNRAVTLQIITALITGLDKGQKQALEKTIQLAYGLMVNALLHNPGPLSLKDKNLKSELLDVLSPYLAGMEHQSTTIIKA